MAQSLTQAPELTVDSLLTVVRLVAQLPSDDPDYEPLLNFLEGLEPLPLAHPFGAEECAHFKEHGWVLIRDFFEGWTEAVKKVAMDAFARRDPATTRRRFEPLGGHAIHDAWTPTTDPVLQASTQFGPSPVVAKKLLGVEGTLTLRNTVLFLKQPPLTYGSPWHTDTQDLPAVTDPGVNVWISLDTADAESGAVQLVAGSHLLSHAEKSQLRDTESIRRIEAGEIPELCHPIPGLLPGDHEFVAPSFEAGDALIFDSSMIHGSGGSLADRPVAAIGTLWHSPIERVGAVRPRERIGSC